MQWRNTGYRAAWQADGQVDYLGPVASRRRLCPAPRIGRYSIDPNEVEAVLQLHPLVDRVAVVCSAERDRGGRLAAFVVPQSNSQIAIAAGGHALAVNELRRYLVERLPGPMVPMAWRTVDSLPVDALGNVDRILLPALANARRHAPGICIAQRRAGSTCGGDLVPSVRCRTCWCHRWFS